MLMLDMEKFDHFTGIKVSRSTSTIKKKHVNSHTKQKPPLFKIKTLFQLG